MKAFAAVKLHWKMKISNKIIFENLKEKKIIRKLNPFFKMLKLHF